MSKNCSSNHRYLEKFLYLPDNQGDVGRHKCAGCAYDLGKLHAQMGLALFDAWVLDSLPESQAGTVRHKDAYTAYLSGYDDGCAMLSLKEAA